MNNLLRFLFPELKKFLLIFFTLSSLQFIALGQSVELARDGESQHVIVIPDNAEPATKTAARELAHYLQLTTKAEFPIKQESDVKENVPQIIVGPCKRISQLLPDVDPLIKGHDSIFISTAGNSLILNGQLPRGPLYAVYTFLEDVVGYRWWTSTESFVPEKSVLTIKELKLQHTPKMGWRGLFYRDMFYNAGSRWPKNWNKTHGLSTTNTFAAKLKVNCGTTGLPKEYGGVVRVAWGTHSSLGMLPPEKYFDKHPEWYSEIKGKRIKKHSQLCYTNKESVPEIAEQVCKTLRKHPSINMISVSQMDWQNWCQCKNCKAVYEREGAKSGAVVQYVNAVAQEVEKEFPNAIITTLAYQQTRTPPKHIRPRQNVAIRICATQCAYEQPYATGERNAGFRKDVEAWSSISSHLIVWDYVANYENSLLPRPNISYLGSNIRFFNNNKGLGIFTQGTENTTIGDFVGLRAWVLGHILWDASRDEGQLINEFLNGYYGKAGPYLRRYLNCLEKEMKSSGQRLDIYESNTRSWLSADGLEKATKFFKLAELAVKNEPVFAARVKRERASLDLVWLGDWHYIKCLRKLQNRRYYGPKDPVAILGRLNALAKKYNNPGYREARIPYSTYCERWRKRLEAHQKPLPGKLGRLSLEQWWDLQPLDLKKTWVRPFKVVDDPEASAQEAIELNPASTKTGIEWIIPDDLPGEWYVYVVARCKASSDFGDAMNFGIYGGKKYPNINHRKKISTKELKGENYKCIYVGKVPLKQGVTIWISAAGRSKKQLENIWIDRVLITKKKAS